MSKYTLDVADRRWPSEAQRLIRADLCRRSFYHFCYYAFGFGINPEGSWFTERVHKPACDWLQAHAEGWFKRRSEKKQGRMKLMIIWPRTHGKTTLVTKAFQCWCHLHDRNLSSVTDSEDAEKACEFMKGITEVISGNDPYAQFAWLYGNWKDPRKTWSVKQVNHGFRNMESKTEPSFGTTSVNTGKTGYHPDMVVLDDPISYEGLKDSGAKNEQAHLHIGSLIPVIKPNGAFIFVGTRYLDDDPAGRLMLTEGVKTLSGMPMNDERIRLSSRGQWHVYFLQAELGIDDDGMPIPLLPEAWSAQELYDYKSSRPVHYSAQMMNEPAIGEHNPVTQELVDRMWVNRSQVPRNVVLTIHMDTAFRYSKRVARSDSTVVQVWAHTTDGSGWVYFMEGRGSPRWGADRFSRELVKMVQQYRNLGYHVRAITDEMEIGGKEGTYKLYLESIFHKAGTAAPPIILIRRFGAGVKKDDRLRDVANYWIDGKVWLCREAPGVQELVSQMTRIGVSAHDDWADAAADVFHPNVYYATRLTIGGEDDERQNYPVRPWDDMLQGGNPAMVVGAPLNKIPDSVVREIYDQYHGDVEPPDLGPGVARSPID
jgi:hypothetical protein